MQTNKVVNKGWYNCIYLDPLTEGAKDYTRTARMRYQFLGPTARQDHIIFFRSAARIILLFILVKLIQISSFLDFIFSGIVLKHDLTILETCIHCRPSSDAADSGALTGSTLLAYRNFCAKCENMKTSTRKP